uniref:Uncharacterized protein n=1 Tax=Rhizophora mucronata TaxID=61149 RepID=A0A2P2PMQ4_RHIMU
MVSLTTTELKTCKLFCLPTL